MMTIEEIKAWRDWSEKYPNVSSIYSLFELAQVIYKLANAAIQFDNRYIPGRRVGPLGQVY